MGGCRPCAPCDAPGQRSLASVRHHELALLREELIRRGAEDQRVREVDVEAMSGDERRSFFAEVQRVDRDNASWLKQVVDRWGWPGRSLVGNEAAHAAWLIVQHADSDPEFQASCLPMLEAAARRGEVEASVVAFLTDRVCVRQGRPQVYGTQYSVRQDANGRAVVNGEGRIEYLVPLVEDVARLDERRAAVGLGPWIEYERSMAHSQGRPLVDTPRSDRH